MKTINTLIFGSAILLLSGCSSTFLADFARPSQDYDEPDAHWYNDPWFQTAADYVPPDENVTPANNDVRPLRNAGYVRRNANTSSSTDSRSTAAVRTRSNSTSQQPTQTNSTAAVPTRGDTGSQSGAAKRSTRDNTVPSRDGRR